MTDSRIPILYLQDGFKICILFYRTDSGSASLSTGRIQDLHPFLQDGFRIWILFYRADLGFGPFSTGRIQDWDPLFRLDSGPDPLFWGPDPHQTGMDPLSLWLTFETEYSEVDARLVNTIPWTASVCPVPTTRQLRRSAFNLQILTSLYIKSFKMLKINVCLRILKEKKTKIHGWKFSKI